MKIVYCIDEIEASGGTERITVTKANALARIPTNEVFIIVAYNRNNLINALDNVKLIDLDVRYYADSGLGKIKELLFVLNKRKEHARKMRSALESISPDIVVSTGMSEKFFIQNLSISSSPCFVREIHFSKYYRRLTAESLYEKIIAFGGELFDYLISIGGYDKIVVLTDEDRLTNWKSNPKVVSIPNPLSQPSTEISDLSNKTVISAGRLERLKNFESLISAWRYVSRKHHDWALKIYGKGSQYDILLSKIKALGLEGSVFLEGFSHDIMHEISQSSIYTLTSITEGMPLVLIEAMTCGVPIVSYMCPSGPKDIISEGENGFLVPVGDEKALADRINQLIEDEEQRREIGCRALEMSKAYSLDMIIPRWMALFNKLLEEKRKNR